jgi:glycosyltransferase involved in cell wall biosynthesis
MRFRQGLVSVCLPVHNGERYLDGAIESVLSQTYEDLELIIFDDFSTDHSLEIIETYAAKDRRISHWRNARRLGLYETFNQCLGQAAGQFIKPFSQDDLLRTPALAKCVHQLILEPTAALATIGYELMDARSNLLKDAEKCGAQDAFNRRKLVTASEVLEKCLFPLTNHLGEVSSIMFRAQHQGTGFDSRLHHFAEIDYWMRILMQGDYLTIPETYAFVRHHLGSAAVNNSRNLMGACDLIKIARKYSRVIEACGKTEEEFLDLSIAAYIAQMEDQLTDGSVSAQHLRRADDLRIRAEINSAHEANASTTAAFSALASALAEGDVSCLSFTPEPTETAAAILQDLIDFREFSFHAIRLLARGGLTSPVPVAGPSAGKQDEHTNSYASASGDQNPSELAHNPLALEQQEYAIPYQDYHDYQDITIFEEGLEDLEEFADLRRKKKTILDHMLTKPLEVLKQTTTREARRERTRSREPVNLP